MVTAGSSQSPGDGLLRTWRGLGRRASHALPLVLGLRMTVLTPPWRDCQCMLGCPSGRRLLFALYKRSHSSVLSSTPSCALVLYEVWLSPMISTEAQQCQISCTVLTQVCFQNFSFQAQPCPWQPNHQHHSDALCMMVTFHVPAT